MYTDDFELAAEHVLLNIFCRLCSQLHIASNIHRVYNNTADFAGTAIYGGYKFSK